MVNLDMISAAPLGPAFTFPEQQLVIEPMVNHAPVVQRADIICG